jgi:hypothetical protein
MSSLGLFVKNNEQGLVEIDKGKFVSTIPRYQLYASYASYIINDEDGYSGPSQDAYVLFTLDILKQSTKGLDIEHNPIFNSLFVDGIKIPFTGIPDKKRNHIDYCAEILIYLRTEFNENKRRLLTEINLFSS